MPASSSGHPRPTRHDFPEIRPSDVDAARRFLMMDEAEPKAPPPARERTSTARIPASFGIARARTRPRSL